MNTDDRDRHTAVPFVIVWHAGTHPVHPARVSLALLGTLRRARRHHAHPEAAGGRLPIPRSGRRVVPSWHRCRGHNIYGSDGATLIPSLKPDGDGGYASTFTFGLSAGTSGSATSASTAGGASVGAALASATCTRSALGVRSVAAKLRTTEQVALDVRLRAAAARAATARWSARSCRCRPGAANDDADRRAFHHSGECEQPPVSVPCSACCSHCRWPGHRRTSSRSPSRRWFHPLPPGVTAAR